MTYPQPNGLDWDQLTVVVELLGRSPLLLGVSIADYRPDLDPTGEFAARIVEVLERALSASPSDAGKGSRNAQRRRHRVNASPRGALIVLACAS